MNAFAMSGSAIRVDETNVGPGKAVGVIEWTHDQGGCLAPGSPNPRHGLCGIHVDVWDVDAPRPGTADTANGYLVADVTYATNGIGGEFTVGLTRGTKIAVGGVDVISLKAYFVSGLVNADGTEIAAVIGQRKRVQATFTWPVSAVDNEPTIALPGIVFGGAATSAFFKIPRQTRAMVVQSTAPAARATLQADFARTANAATIQFSTLDPVGTGSFIEGGVEFFRVVSTGAAIVTPVFDLI